MAWSRGPGGRSGAAMLVGVVILLGVGVLLLQVGRGLPTATTGSTGTGRSTSNSAFSPSPAATSSPSTPGSTGSPATEVVLVGAGDIADCASKGDEATAKLLDGIDGTVFTLGDNAYTRGTLEEYDRCYDPTWGRQLARTKPIPGNHEYLTSGAAGYFRYFGAAAGDPQTGWYAYDAGAWRVYALNGNCAEVGGCDAGSEQARWLRRDLAANPRDCVLAMWHQPRFSSGLHGNDDSTQGMWQALYDAGAELILDGHDHDYERFAPQTPAGASDQARGIVEIVVGTGGRDFYDFYSIRANSLVRNNDTHGVLRLALTAGAWSFQFVPVAAATFSDSGTGTCH